MSNPPETDHLEAAAPVAAAAEKPVPETLPDLMTRFERRRQYYLKQNDYVRLMMLGGGFVLGAMVLGGVVRPLYLVVMLCLFSPYLLGAARFSQFRLQEDFMRSVIAHFWRRQGDGQWLYEAHAGSFPIKEFHATRLVPGQVSIGEVVRGALCGQPALFADVARIMGKRFSLRKTVRGGWLLCLRPHDPEKIMERLKDFPALKAVRQGDHVWIFQDTPLERYGRISLKTPLNHPEPYERVQQAVEQMHERALALACDPPAENPSPLMGART